MAKVGSLYLKGSKGKLTRFTPFDTYAIVYDTYGKGC